MLKQRRHALTADGARDIAVAALARLAGDGERLARFLALAGLGPANLRAAAAEPGFLAGVLDFHLADEALLLDLAAALGIPPQDVRTARDLLAGPGAAA